jgi:hypothetical protein
MEELPTPLKKVCQQMGTAERVNVTFDDLAGCDSVLLVQYLFIYNLCVCISCFNLIFRKYVN